MSKEQKIIRYLVGEVAREYQVKRQFERAVSVLDVKLELSNGPAKTLNYVLDGED